MLGELYELDLEEYVDRLELAEDIFSQAPMESSGTGSVPYIPFCHPVSGGVSATLVQKYMAAPGPLSCQDPKPYAML